MSYLVFYTIFAIATSLSSIYEIFWPAISGARQLGIKNDLTDSIYLSTFIVFLINTLFAPLVFLILVIPGASTEAMRGIVSIVHEERKSDLE